MTGPPEYFQNWRPVAAETSRGQRMKAVLAVLTASLIVAASAGGPAEAARSGKVLCGGVHTPRAGNTEIADTAISVRNATGTDVRITRFTFRDFFGNVAGDFGEGADPATNLPTNRDFSPPVDVTTVPPGASYYLATSHIFGTTFLPGPAGAGNNISITVEFATEGDVDLAFVGGPLRVVELLGGLGGGRGQEHSRSSIACHPFK